MANLHLVKAKVSANVLNMHFMKRTTIKIEEQEKAKRQAETLKTDVSKSSRVFPTVQTINDEPTCSVGSKFNEERFTVLEDLRFGRFSYEEQNKEVEKLMVYYECKRKGIDCPEEDIRLMEE